MFEPLLHRLLERRIRTGALEIAYPSGRRARYGDGTGPAVALAIADAATLRAIVLAPQLAVGEAYMDGRLRLEAGDLADLMALTRRNLDPDAFTPVARAFNAVRAVGARLRRIGPERARANVAHHYDLDERLYRLFLDADMQYSCAYFERPDMSLEEAQLAKKRLIAAKLLIEPGARVLDIGSGWGGMALYLAEVCGADVTGITLSVEQHRVAAARAEARGLADRVRFEIRDYRQVTGAFDAIVSVGMFEHVGLRNYPAFFETFAARLAPSGVGLLHAIGVPRRSLAPQAFIAKYIFPGGFLPSLAEEAAAIEPTGLQIRDVEVLALHYAETLRCWRERFLANRDRVLELYDERFLRMWDFYLAGSEGSFRFGETHVHQLQLAHDPARIPITRDYIAERMAALAARERETEDYAPMHEPAPRPRRRA